MNQENIVYSTDPNFSRSSDIVESDSILNVNHNLRVHLDRRKGGKIVTLIRGYNGAHMDLIEMCSSMKKKFSIGGTVKHGTILLQGDCRDKVIEFLKSDGHIAKPAGG